MLIDLCGVDYLHYGLSEWRTETTTATGFSRGTDTGKMHRVKPWDKQRFAVVYHLLSVTNNLRVRLKVFVSENDMMVPSVMPIWDAANWFEREAFDLFGFEFESFINSHLPSDNFDILNGTFKTLKPEEDI